MLVVLFLIVINMVLFLLVKSENRGEGIDREGINSNNKEESNNNEEGRDTENEGTTKTKNKNTTSRNKTK